MTASNTEQFNKAQQIKFKAALSSKPDKIYIFIYYPMGYGLAINVRYNSNIGSLEFANSNGGFNFLLEGELWENFCFSKCNTASLYYFKHGLKEFILKDYVL